MCIKIHYYVCTFQFSYLASARGVSLNTDSKYAEINTWLSYNYETMEVMKGPIKGKWLNKPKAYSESVKGKRCKDENTSPCTPLSGWWPLVLCKILSLGKGVHPLLMCRKCETGTTFQREWQNVNTLLAILYWLHVKLLILLAYWANWNIIKW